MKKHLLRLVSISLLISLCFPFFSSCSEPNTGSEQPTESSSQAISLDSSEESSTDPEQTTPQPSPDVNLPKITQHWTFDSLSEDGKTQISNGSTVASVLGCDPSENAVSGKSLTFMASECSNVQFGTGITDLLKQYGTVSFSFWFYRTTPGRKAEILNLYMEDGKTGIRIDIEDSLITVSARSDTKDTFHVKSYDCAVGWGKWGHLAVSVDYRNGKILLYWNGTEKTAKLGGTNTTFRTKGYQPGTPTQEDSLGGNREEHFDQTGFNGCIDEFTVTTGVYTASDVRSLYKSVSTATAMSQIEIGMYNSLRTLTTSGSVVIAQDSNAVLSQGKRLFLVPGNTMATVLEKNGSLYVPASFFEDYFKKALSSAQSATLEHISFAGADYVPLESSCSLLQIPCRVTNNSIVMLGENTTAFSDSLISFLYSYYYEDGYALPETEDDHAVTRIPIAYSNYNSNKISLGSPAIGKFSNGTLIASYDYNGDSYQPINGGTNDTGINISTDGGNTWKKVATVPRLMWCTLFIVNDVVYLVGRDTKTAKLGIVKSSDYGVTWTSPDQGQIDTTVGSLHHAPTPAVISNGRIFIAFEDSCNAEGVAKWNKTKRAYVMSAPLDADLLDQDSWLKSNCVGFELSWLDPNLYYSQYIGFLEGNAVAGPNGEIYVILRVESDPTYGKACVLKLSADYSTLSFDRIIDLPVGKDKFVIRYDAVTDCYIAIGNIKTVGTSATQRNVVAMYISKDLANWEYAATLLTDNSLLRMDESMYYRGMQYPDFIIDGDDLCLVLREASENTTYYHNANYITWYKICDFRKYIS